jgi:hypothetical protein
MTTPISFEEKLRADYYTTKERYAFRKHDLEQYHRYHTDANRLAAEFKADLLENLGLTDHPKADIFWHLAWDYGHSAGFFDVYNYATELATLLK